MTEYVIITPVKDEEKYIRFTIESVINQKIQPSQWIIVDDGSIDKTNEIIASYSKKYDWIKGVYTSDKGPRKPGIRHIRAFYEGYSRLDSTTWDFIVKLDGDLSFSEEYFEKCFSYFNENPKLGIGGGVILNVIDGNLIPEKSPLFHVRGATKIYRRRCWDAIGGLLISPCYDTLDEVKANMLGYETRSFIDLKLIHHRYTGQSSGKWGNAVKCGLNNYISGYHPLFMLLKCAKRSTQKPFLIDALGHLHGYISGYIQNVPQASDKALISYLRKQQLKRLVFKKSIWR